MDDVGEIFLTGEQDVAYEIEIDNGFSELKQELEVQPPIEVLTGNEQMFDGFEQIESDRWVDEDGLEYFFEESSQTYQQVVPKITKQCGSSSIEEDESELNYIDPVGDEEEEGEEEEEEEEAGPSTSTAQPSVYLIKRGGKRKYENVEATNQSYKTISFRTTLHGDPKSKGWLKRRKIKAVDPEDVEQMVENGQILKKLQEEILGLRQDNIKLKKEYESVFKRNDGLRIVYNDAKQRFKEVNDEKKQLVMTLTKLRMAKKNILRKSWNPWQYKS